MIKLVIDRTCDIPKSVVEKYQIAVLPLQVTIGERSYRDGIDIEIEQPYGVMRQGIVPKTSQINISETEALFREICQSGSDLIYLCFSSQMSATYQVAQMVMDELREEFPHLNMRVVDSQGGSFAAGLIAMQAARWIAGGTGYNGIIALMNDMISQVRHLFALDSLSWLAKGGRISRPAGFIGDKLQLKPILHVVDGAIQVANIVRGRKNTLNTIAQMLFERVKSFPAQLIGITHADDMGTAQHIEQVIQAMLPKAKTKILPIGCVLGCHIGIGGVGMFFLKKPAKGYDLLCETGF
ncbi:MAG: DegV family protein [Eubacteriales bacterium]|nr:DegV family protein [Eubacteriales bacterium]